MLNPATSTMISQAFETIRKDIHRRIELYRLSAQIREERRELLGLDAHMRADIGKTDAEISLEARRGFTDIPADRLPKNNQTPQKPTRIRHGFCAHQMPPLRNR